VRALFVPRMERIQFARFLRQTSNAYEQQLWALLRNRQRCGAKLLGITKQGKVAKWPVALRYVTSNALTPVPSPRKYLGEGRTILSCQVFSRNPIARKLHVERNAFPSDQ